MSACLVYVTSLFAWAVFIVLCDQFSYDVYLSYDAQLGTHKRALKKREQIKETYGKMRAKAAMSSAN